MMAAMSCALLTSGCAAMSGMRSFAVRMPPKYNSIPLSLKVAPLQQRHSTVTMATTPTTYTRPRLTFGRIMVAIAYGKYGVLYPFLPVYLKAYLQLPAMWVGVLTMIFPICIALVAPLITAFADACGKHKEIFLVSQLLSAVFAVALFLVGGQPYLILALLLSWACSDAAMTSFTDSALLGLMGNMKGGYGQMRCFGSLGYAATVFLSGHLQAWFGWTAPFFGMAFLSLTYAGIIISLPHDLFTPAEQRALKSLAAEATAAAETAAERKRAAEEEERARRAEEARARRVERARARLPATLSDAPTLIFLSSVLACGVAQGVMDNCLFLRLRDLGAASGLMGLGRAAMCVSEVPFFYFSGKLYKRFGIEQIMLFAVSTHVLQARAYALMVDPRFCVLTESLNGIVWGFMWPCALLHAQRLVPDCLKTTMVGLVTSIYWGVGASTGALAAAWLYARIGSAGAFASLSNVLLVPAMLLATRMLLTTTQPKAVLRYALPRSSTIAMNFERESFGFFAKRRIVGHDHKVAM